MRIYKQEQTDGLSESLSDPKNSVANVLMQVQEKQETTNTIAPTSEQLIAFLHKTIEELKNKSDANIDNVEDLIGHDQPDLALVISILVSTGWNLNDDVFVPSEVWAARNTPIHKPMNHMHDGTIVVGHIVESKVVDKNGDTISSDNFDDVPEKFDIEVAGVIYKSLPGREELIEDIISKANNGEMFVSMEAFFKDFDYAILDASNSSFRVLARTEETAFLTKHLRSFGGTGKFNGAKIGRVLKSMVFGGQGFVDNPANPDSVIKTIALNNSSKIKLDEIMEGGVVSVNEIQKLEEQRNELQTKADELVKENESMKKELDSVKKKDLETKVGALNQKIEELNETIAKTQQEVETVKSEKIKLQKDLDDAVSRADNVEKEFNEINKKIKAKERFVKLSEVKDIEDEEATLAELATMSEDTFETVMKYAGSSKHDEVEDEKNKKEKEAGNTKSEEEDMKKVDAALDGVTENEEAELQVDSESDSETKDMQGLAHALCSQKQENE